jgi:hypothetical protein
MSALTDASDAVDAINDGIASLIIAAGDPIYQGIAELGGTEVLTAMTNAQQLAQQLAEVIGSDLGVRAIRQLQHLDNSD